MARAQRIALAGPSKVAKYPHSQQPSMSAPHAPVTNAKSVGPSPTTWYAIYVPSGVFVYRSPASPSRLVRSVNQEPTQRTAPPNTAPRTGADVFVTGAPCRVRKPGATANRAASRSRVELHRREEAWNL